MADIYARWVAAQNDPAYWGERAKLDFAVELNSKMEEQKISRTELAQKVNVSKAYISKILGGYANFTIESMSKLAFAMGFKIGINFYPIKYQQNTYVPHLNSVTNFPLASNDNSIFWVQNILSDEEHPVAINSNQLHSKDSEKVAA
jgi:transcriptional regulator with XRE-family HTH domain